MNLKEQIAVILHPEYKEGQRLAGCWELGQEWRQCAFPPLHTASILALVRAEVERIRAENPYSVEWGDQIDRHLAYAEACQAMMKTLQ